LVDVDRRPRQPVAGARQLRPLVGRQLALVQASRVDAALGAHQPAGHLLTRHLEREHGDRPLLADADVGGHVQRQRGLPHAGAGGQDQQVRVLKARRQLVEVAIAGGDAGQVLLRLVELCDPLERLGQQVGHRAEVVRDPLVGDREHDLLGLVDDLLWLAQALESDPGDLGAGVDQVPERARIADDLGVPQCVGYRGNGRRQGVHHGLAADLVDQAAALERVEDGDRIDRLALAVHRQHGLVEELVRPAVEVLRPQHLGHDRNRVRRDQHRAQHRFFRVQILWRKRLG
jgi:hypothetical protein